MFLKYLKSDVHELFLQLSSLVAVVDNEIGTNVEIVQVGSFWESGSGLKTTNRVDSEFQLLSCYATQELSVSIGDFKRIYQSVDTTFVKEVSHVDEDAEEYEKNINLDQRRVYIAAKLARRYIREATNVELTPSVKKAMLIELALITLADGIVTEFESMLMKKITTAFDLEEVDFEELLEAAKSINTEVVKATALILE